MVADEQREQMNSDFDEEREMLGVDEDDLPGQAIPLRAVVPRYAPRSLLQAQAALLDNTIISIQTDPETYRLVRTHFAALEQWHIQHTGWRIQRSSSLFRLERHLHMIAPVFLDDKLKRARDFACLVWLLWFAEKRYLAGGGRNQQFLLSQLADELQQQSQLAANTALDFRNQH